MKRPVMALDHRRLRHSLALRSAPIFAVRVSFLGVSFVIGVVLARTLGTEGFGHYALALAWTGLLGVLVTLGMPELITREVAAQSERGTWGRLKGMLVWSDRAILAASSGLALLAIGLCWIVFGQHDPPLFWAASFALASLPAYGLMRSATATIQGLHVPLASQVPELVVRPVSFLMLFVVMLFSPHVVVTGAVATALFAVSRVFAMVAGYLLLARVRPTPLAEARPETRGTSWLRESLPFLAISSIFVVSSNTDAIMLGALRGADEVAIFSVANQGAQLILLALMAAHVVVLPEVTRLFEKGDMAELQRLVTQSARVVSVVALGIGGLLIMLGHWFLLIFGAAFTIGYGALVLLSIAQMVNAITGLAGPVLSMTNFARTTAWAFGIGACTNVALNALLIPIAGVNGAAIATGVSVIVQNVLLAVLVRRRLGVNTLPFGRVPTGATPA